MNMSELVRRQSVGIIGAGAAALITGHVLLRDGFQNVQLLTRDKYVGGVWAKERVYPGVTINNVRGEFWFSPLPMPPPAPKERMGNRISGQEMTAYMETFADTFLAGKIRFQTEILDVRRAADGTTWEVQVLDLKTGTKEVLSFARIVLCTGGCSRPFVPGSLSVESVHQAGFRGLVIHSSEFAPQYDRILNAAQSNPDYSVVIVGGGRSAQDLSSYLARHGIKVSVVFEKTDIGLATPFQLPGFIRLSRFLGVLSPHIELRTNLERFLHTTTFGSMITHGFWNFLTNSSFHVLKIPKDSPLRNTHSLFWGIRTTDEGAGNTDGFHVLVNQGKIKLVAPNRATGYSPDGQSIVLQHGSPLPADAVILATGFSSSWEGIFTKETIEELGIGRRAAVNDVDEWSHYTTLASPPTTQAPKDRWTTSIYRGLIPAKNINKRDFAINGALFTTNNGYSFEVMAHWISSYFLGDKMHLPSTVEEALAVTERNSAWMRKRYPEMLTWVNESYSSSIAFWTWPQAMDELLDDMRVPSMRSGGNWFTWPFEVISPNEIAMLGEERRARREADVGRGHSLPN